VRKSNSKK